MDIIHFFLFPVYVILPIFIVLYYRTYYLTDPNDKFFFAWGFFLKMFGVLTALAIYTFYYNGGDTTYFQDSGVSIANYISRYPLEFFEVIGREKLSDYNPIEFIQYKEGIVYYNDKYSFTIVKIAILFNLLTFNSFLLTSILCGYFSFYASWSFYKFIIEKITIYKKQVGYAIFFMPSVVFWGSGLFKDTFTLAGLYFFIVGFVNFFGYKKYSIKNFIFVLIGYYLLVNIRSFFLVVSLPFILVWIFSANFSRIQSTTLKFLFIPFFFVMITIGSVGILNVLSDVFKELTIENLQDRTKGFQSWHTTLKGSAYSLGENIDFTPSGIVKVFPAAVNVTFFRPYITETNKPIIILSFLQSFMFTLIMVYTLFKTRFVYFFIHLFKSAEGLSLMGFSLFYAFVAGFTSYNFGALDRYKIPCLSSFILSLIFIYESFVKSQKQHKQ